MSELNLEPDWERQCDVCEQTPVVPLSGLCGPCHFGTADALNGGWWDDKKNEMREDFSF